MKPLKKYEITETVQRLIAPIEITLVRSNKLSEDASETAPETLSVRSDYYEIGKKIGLALQGVKTDSSKGALSYRDLELVSNAISVDRDNWKYRVPMPILVELMTDSNEAMTEAKKKQPNTPSSSTTGSQKRSTRKASPKKRKGKKS